MARYAKYQLCGLAVILLALVIAHLDPKPNLGVLILSGFGAGLVVAGSVERLFPPRWLPPKPTPPTLPESFDYCACEDDGPDHSDHSDRPESVFSWSHSRYRARRAAQGFSGQTEGAD